MYKSSNNLQCSIKNGLLWLSSVQNKDGSFGTLNPITTTALAIQAFSNSFYSIPTPVLCNKCNCNTEIDLALKYILTNAKVDNNGVYFEENGNIDKPTGEVLAALLSLNSPFEVVNIPNSPIDGYTFERLIDNIIDYLVASQNDNGSWGCSSNYDPCSNNNTTSFVIKGLSLAKCKGYFIPQSVFDNLQIWVEFIQNNCGGAGECSPCEGVNIANTAILIQLMSFLGYSCCDKNLRAAIQYIANNWYMPVSYFNPGWHCGDNLDYKAAYEVMTALPLCNVKCLQTCTGKVINWFSDIINTLLRKQNQNGSWPASEIDYEQSDQVIATIYSILTLEIALAKIYRC